METEVPLSRIKAPDSIFKNRVNREDVSLRLTDKARVYITEKITAVEGEGIFTYYQGVKSPRIGLSPTYEQFPQIMNEANKVKRIIMTALKMFSFHPIQRGLDGFNEIAGMCLDPWYLKTEYYSPCAWGVYEFVSEALVAYGIKLETADKTAETIAMLFECDDAYRYPMEDGMGETSKERMMKNPRKEIKRALKIIASRWNTDNGNKFKKISKLITLLFLLPKVKYGILKGLEKMKFDNWQMTDGDEIQCLKWPAYNVRGRNWEERDAIYRKIYGANPPQIIEIRVK